MRAHSAHVAVRVGGRRDLRSRRGGRGRLLPHRPALRGGRRGGRYVAHTMALAPLRRDSRTAGVLSVLDRRDGRPYGPADLVRNQPAA